MPRWFQCSPPRLCSNVFIKETTELGGVVHSEALLRNIATCLACLACCRGPNSYRYCGLILFPNAAIVAHTLNLPHNDIGNYLVFIITMQASASSGIET